MCTQPPPAILALPEAVDFVGRGGSHAHPTKPGCRAQPVQTATCFPLPCTDLVELEKKNQNPKQTGKARSGTHSFERLITHSLPQSVWKFKDVPHKYCFGNWKHIPYWIFLHPTQFESLFTIFFATRLPSYAEVATLVPHLGSLCLQSQLFLTLQHYLANTSLQKDSFVLFPFFPPLKWGFKYKKSWPKAYSITHVCLSDHPRLPRTSCARLALVQYLRV